MSNNYGNSDTLGCRLKLLGIVGYKLDNEDCLIYVDDVLNNRVVLPYGIKGLRGTGFSGLDIESISFNKDLEIFEISSLENCSKLKEIKIYENQVCLISDLHKLYPDISVLIRKEVI